MNEAYGNARIAVSGAVIPFCVAGSGLAHGLPNASAGRIISSQKIHTGGALP
jgi:hypothetical protein